MRQRRGCLGCFGGCLTKLLFFGVVGTAVAWLVTVALYPWSLHIGGRSTPLLYWHGTGTVLAKDGKTYQLYVTFFPGGSSGILRREGKRASAGLRGSGWLCVAPGTPERMRVSGTIYGGYTSSTDSLFAFRLLEWPNLFVTNDLHTGFFDVAGTWHGQQLVMDRPNEQGAAFKSGLLIDHAMVTLHWADKAEFEAACKKSGR
jgi:hypothetical protein